MSRLSGTARSTVASGTVASDHQCLNDACSMAIRPAGRACCCSASPLVRAVYVTSSPTAHSIDLLLCSHHYRRCAAKLATIGAMVFGADGRLLAPDDALRV